MIDGAHVIIYSKDAEADKAFFRNVLGFGHVDVGHGWLIFKLPPAEVAVHPPTRTICTILPDDRRSRHGNGKAQESRRRL